MDLSLPPPDFGASQPTEEPRSKYLPQILKGLGVADGTKWSELTPDVKRAATQVLRGVALGQSPEEALKKAGESVARKAVQDAAKQVTSKILSGSNTAQSVANAAVSSLIDGASGKEAVKTAAKTAASKTLGDAADRMVPGSGDVAGKIISGLFEGEDLGDVAKNVGKGLASQAAGKAASSLLSSVPGVGGLASGLVSDLLDDGKINTGSAVVTGLSAAANLIPGVGTVASALIGTFGGGLAAGINRDFFAYGEEYGKNKEFKDQFEKTAEKIGDEGVLGEGLAERAKRAVRDVAYLGVKDETPDNGLAMLENIQNTHRDLIATAAEETDPTKKSYLEAAAQAIEAGVNNEQTKGNYERMIKEQEQIANKKDETAPTDNEQQVAQAEEPAEKETEDVKADDRTQQPADKPKEGDKTETVTLAQAEEEGEKDNKGEKDQQQITLDAPVITGINGGTVATSKDGELVLVKEEGDQAVEAPKETEETPTETEEVAKTEPEEVKEETPKTEEVTEAPKEEEEVKREEA